MAHALTSPYRGYDHEAAGVHHPEIPAGETGSAPEPHKELMACMLYHTRTAFEGLAESCGRWKDYTQWKDDEARDALQPVVQALAWLSEPSRVGSPGITFGQCCEYLNLDMDQVRGLMIDLFRKVPAKGQQAVRWYVGRLVDEPRFASVHYKGAPPIMPRFGSIT